jgi:hypothetical protein
LKLFIRNIVFPFTIWLGCLYSTLPSIAQAPITFSKLLYDTIPVIYKNVVVQENGYLVTALSLDADTAAYYAVSTYLFNLNGEKGTTKRYGNASQSLFALDMNTTLSDGTTVFTAADFSESVATMSLIWMLPNGDTLRTKEFVSPLYVPGENQNDWLAASALTSDPNDNIYLCCIVSTPENGNDFIVFAINSQGILLWTYLYELPNGYDGCNAIISNEQGIFCASGHFFPDDLPIGCVEHFIQLDYEGNLIWEGEDLTESNFHRPDAVVIEDDGLIAAANLVYEDHRNIIVFYKYNFDGSIIWYNELDIPNSSYPNSLIKTCDNGYLINGPLYYFNEPADSIDGVYNRDNVIHKFDHDGNHQWTRKYNIISSVHENHLMFDVKSTPDGGFVLAGVAENLADDLPPEEIPYQHGWLLKLDACGCLVPGCDMACDNMACFPTELPFDHHQMIAGPNPVNDLLNVYLSPQAPLHGTLCLFDLSGKIVQQFDYINNDTTFIWDVSTQPAGEYVLALMDQGSLVESIKILVAP